VKVAFADGELLMEAHPAVDDEGQNTADPNMELLSEKLDQALGSTTAAIHWDFAKQALQAANGIPTVVGIQADMSPEQAEAAEAADSSDQHPTQQTPDTATTPVAASPTAAAPATESTSAPAETTLSQVSPAQDPDHPSAAAHSVAAPEPQTAAADPRHK
jgi:hypothetical protein